MPLEGPAGVRVALRTGYLLYNYGVCIRIHGVFVSIPLAVVTLPVSALIQKATVR
jgi:hypothetical protein